MFDPLRMSRLEWTLITARALGRRELAQVEEKVRALRGVLSVDRVTPLASGLTVTVTHLNSRPEGYEFRGQNILQFKADLLAAVASIDTGIKPAYGGTISPLIPAYDLGTTPLDIAKDAAKETGKDLIEGTKAAGTAVVGALPAVGLGLGIIVGLAALAGGVYLFSRVR